MKNLLIYEIIFNDKSRANIYNKKGENHNKYFSDYNVLFRRRKTRKFISLVNWHKGPIQFRAFISYKIIIITCNHNNNKL